MKQVNIDISKDLFRELKLTALHDQTEVEAVILTILKTYYDRKGD